MSDPGIGGPSDREEAATQQEVDRFKRLESLFLDASELTGEARERLLLESCADDLDLLEEARKMLGLESQAERQLQAAVAEGLDHLEEVPERVDVYRILEPLGFGGLGSVYLAERDDGHFEKRVAIKWLRPESLNAEQERRFLLERQVLAALEHPNIARILDGGTHRGAAYLVMEWVQGRHLLDYCREHQLSLNEKLQLFRKVCDAVHYAHQNLVLHCDLKPSNILVEEGGLENLGTESYGGQNIGAQNMGAQSAQSRGAQNAQSRGAQSARSTGAQSARSRGTPKLVDFGIAKALGGSLLSQSNALAATRTHGGLRPLTPEYASPEQAQFRPLTTASDVYSLGIILFEMLTGSRPYRVATSNPIEIAELIGSAEVPRASEPYRAEHGAVPWSSDLDAIVAKATRKEPEQRYLSVEQLSRDLLHYLENKPVAARQGSWLYYWGKLLRRHRLGAAAIVMVLLSMGAATVLTSRQARVAEQERQRAEANLILAEEQKDRAEAVVDLLVDLFEYSDPSVAQGAEVTAREVLDRGSMQIREQLKDRPQLRAALASTIGRVYRQLAMHDEAELHLADSLDTRRRILEGGSPEIVESLHLLARLRLDQNRLAEADQLLAEAVNATEAQPAADEQLGDLLLTAALIRLEEGQLQEARESVRRFLNLPRGPDGQDPADLAEAWDLLSEVAYAEGDYGRAEKLAARGLEARRSVLGGKHPKIARSMNNLAAIRQIRGDLAGARSAFEETLALRRTLYGDAHATVGLSLHNLATLHLREGDVDVAEGYLVEALEILRSIHGGDHPSVADVLFTRAGLESRRGRRAEASSYHEQALTMRRSQLTADHPKVILSLMGLADSLRRTSPRRAETLYREAITLQRQEPDLHGHRRAYPFERLGTLLCDRQPAEAIRHLEEALKIRRESPAADHWHTAQGEARLGQCLAASDPIRATRHLERAIEQLASSLGENHSVTMKARGWLDALTAKPELSSPDNPNPG